MASDVAITKIAGKEKKTKIAVLGTDVACCRWLDLRGCWISHRDF